MGGVITIGVDLAKSCSSSMVRCGGVVWRQLRRLQAVPFFEKLWRHAQRRTTGAEIEPLAHPVTMGSPGAGA